MPDYVPLTFGFEALYPPMALVANSLRDLYIKLAEPCRFSEFRLLGEGQGARLAEGANRQLTITNDRFVYRDEFTRQMFTTFSEDVNLILRNLRQVYQIPVILHTKILVRLLMPYRGEGTTVQYLESRLISEASSHLGYFNRPLSGTGIRLVFPPTQELHSTYHLRIEPYFRDLKMFFLENSAQFFDPLVDFSQAQHYMEDAYNFVKEQAGPFVLALSSP